MATADHDARHVLLERTWQVRPEERRSLRTTEIEVPAGTGALRLVLEVAPRRPRDRQGARRLLRAAEQRQRREAADAGVPVPTVGDGESGDLGLDGLRNLVNLVVTDSAGRHRGRWDRNLPDEENEADIISTHSATPGFVPGPVPAGKWQLTLEIHEVLEPFRLRLRVTASQLPVQVPAARGTGQPPRAARQFRGRLPAGWLRGELHCHSTASDGAFTPAQLQARARDAGLDFLALTDHNSTAGLDGADAAGPLVLSGCEITTFHGHFLALGLPRSAWAPPWYRHDRPLSPAELARDVRDQGALFGVAHPFVLGNPICCGCRLETGLSGEQLDLLEVWSRGAEDPLALRHALLVFDRLRRAGHRVVAVAGRDWHNTAQEGPQFPATVVRSSLDAGQIIAALRRGACYLSRGPVLSLDLVAGDRRAGAGQDLGLPPGQEVAATVVARVQGLATAASLRLLLAGEALLERRVAGPEATLEVPGVRAAVGGVRLELWDEEGAPLVLSNPVEFYGVEAADVGP